MKMTCCAVISVLLVFAVHSAAGGHILVYPFGHCLNSHLLNAETLTETLAEAGHHVDFLVSDAYRSYDHHLEGGSQFLQTPGISLVEFQAPTNYKPICEYDTIDFMLYTPLNIRFNSMVHTMERYCDRLLSDSQLLRRLKDANYDLFILESLDPCSKILADYLDIPFVPLMTTGLGHMDTNPRPPSYLPSAISPFTSEMTFLQRLTNLIMKFMYDNIPTIMGFEPHFEALKQKYRLNQTLSIADTFNRAAIKLVNSDFAIEYPAPIEPDTVLVGGFGIRQPKPLSSELEAFMQSSGEHGVIVVSFGTLVKRYDLDWTRVFLEALSRVPQKIIWRYYGDEEAVVLNKTLGAHNVRLMKWLPQVDLMAHPKTRLFITHCGLNGMFETTYHGVPVIAIPLTGDQMNNGAKLIDHLAMGIKLDIFSLTSEKLHNAIATVLGQSIYKHNALAVSSLLRDQPISASEKVKYWVSYVIRHQGAAHLKSIAHTLTWYQYFSLDVLAFLLLLAMLVLILLVVVLYKLAVMLMDRFVPTSVWKAKIH